MKTKEENGRVTGITLLQILFIGLKLTGHIDWSWWWVMAPTWGSFFIALAIIFFATLVRK